MKRIDSGDVASKIADLIQEADKSDRQINADVRIESVEPELMTSETETGPVAEFIVSTSDKRSFIVSIVEFQG